ncbi:cytochrome c [Neisseria dentiae]|uniref:c-type cytochrome n=1 Tax=Neisseria dentiae TaxID=194197 RepID=UPI0035A0F47B
MKKHFLALLCTVLAAGWVHADAGDIKARQQYMKEWRGLNKKMGDILKKSDAQSFPAKEFAALAAQLNETAGEPWKHYGAGSNGSGSDAKAAVWENPQAFQTAIKRFNDAAAALNQAAQRGDYAAVKASFGQVGQSCKACHQDFKD